MVPTVPVCCVQIERLKLQLSEQETSNKSRSEELDKLKTQFEQLKREEQEYKQKVCRLEPPPPPPPPPMCMHVPIGILKAIAVVSCIGLGRYKL